MDDTGNDVAFFYSYVGIEAFFYGYAGIFSSNSHRKGDRFPLHARILFYSYIGINNLRHRPALRCRAHVKHASSTLLIGAVNNELARRELALAQGALWLDAGNHRQAGQIVIGQILERDVMLQHIDGKDGVYTHLPNAALLFPQLLEPEAPSESGQEMQDVGRSCAELVATGSQGLFVNDLVAAIASQYIWRILYRQPIHTFASFVDGDTLCARSLPICRDELLPYLERQ